MNIVTYTAVFGGYDTLQPTQFPSICVTDRNGDVPGWEYKVALMPLEPKLRNRWAKMHPHQLFPYADASIYFDGNIELLVDPRQLVEKYLSRREIAVFNHPERNCVYDEGDAVVRLRKGNKRSVLAHLRCLKQQGYPKGRGLSACWVLIRKHTSRVALLNEVWWAEFLQSSTGRDQLTFDYVCWKLGVKCETIPGNLFRGTSQEFRRSKHVRS